jgi:hypothetical protein
MRSVQDVVKRCVCVEIVCQRLALEQQSEEVEDAEKMRADLVTSADKLDVLDAMTSTETAVLQAPLGSLDLEDEAFSMFFADAAVLLWCLNRIEALPTVAELASETLNDVLAAGFWSLGGSEILQAMYVAELRDLSDLQEMLSVVSNAVVKAQPNPPGTDVPPFTVLYVIPWILSTNHPWGKPIDLARALPN